MLGKEDLAVIKALHERGVYHKDIAEQLVLDFCQKESWPEVSWAEGEPLQLSNRAEIRRVWRRFWP